MKPKLLSPGRSIALLASILTIAGAKLQADSTNHFFLATIASQQPGNLFVNGFPLVTLPPTNGFNISSLLSPFLLAGENKFLLRFPDPTNDFKAVQPGSVTIRLEYGAFEKTNRTTRFDFTRFIEANEEGLIEEHELTQVPAFHYRTHGYLKTERTIQTIDLDGRKVEYRFLTNGTVNSLELRLVLAEARLTSLPWQGPAAELADTDRAEITALVRSLHTALSERNFNAAADLMSVRLQRIAAAFESTLEAQRANLIESYTNVFIQEFQLDPLDTAKLEFETFDVANVVRVLAGAEDPIVGRGPDYRFYVSVYVSKVGGRWVIVE